MAKPQKRQIRDAADEDTGPPKLACRKCGERLHYSSSRHVINTATHAPQLVEIWKCPHCGYVQERR
jgi:hypothetical protein